MQNQDNPMFLRMMELLRFAGVHQRHVSELTRATGENFNLFKILGIGHYEVRTHSPMLGNLLNPNGTHGQGDKFLKLFLESQNISDFETSSAVLDLEYYIGPMTEKSGGRIDIVIQNHDRRAIFIENKIYAGDQENQLRRYRQRNSQANLFYLTLDGTHPKGFTEKDVKDINPIFISYKTVIRNWLILCQKEATSLPSLRESILQYLHLILELTNQSTTRNMNEELIGNITADKQSLAAYYSLRDIQYDVQKSIIQRLEKKLEAVAINLGLRFRGDTNFDYSSKGGGFEFSSDDMDSIHLRIRFQFDDASYHNFAFGFFSREILPLEKKELLEKLFEEVYKDVKYNDVWPAWCYFFHYQNMPIGELFAEFQFGNFVNDIEKELKILKEIARRLSENSQSSLV